MLRKIWLALTLSGLLAGITLLRAAAAPLAQAPTAVPFATLTPSGPQVEASDDVNVRSGPGTDYDLIGVMVKGQTGAILGRSPDSKWLLVVYIGGPNNQGWVYKDLIRVVGDVPSFPTVAVPPTPTLPPTPTPGVAAPEGSATPEPGRYPTFTPAPPVARPTLLPVQGANSGSGLPPALLIITLFVLGGIGAFLTLLRRR
jgi:hypothetical protein